MDEFKKHNVEWKRLDLRQYVLPGSLYVKVKTGKTHVWTSKLEQELLLKGLVIDWEEAWDKLRYI